MKEKESGNLVFYVSLILVAVMAVWSVVLNESFTIVSNVAYTFLTTDFGWLYLVSMIVFFGIHCLHSLWEIWKDSSWR